MVESGVLVSPINAVRVPITHPPLGDTHRPAPLLVGGAVELLLVVTLPVVWGGGGGD